MASQNHSIYAYGAPPTIIVAQYAMNLFNLPKLMSQVLADSADMGVCVWPSANWNHFMISGSG